MSGLTKKTSRSLHCFGLAFIPILIALGTWQLHRATEKRQLQMQFQSRHHTILQLTDINTQTINQLQYRTIRVTGHYDNAHQLLLDNKISQHRVGYEVITPFIPQHSPKILLVNRGWIAGTRNRKQLPYITPSTGTQTIEGLVKLPPKKSFSLGQTTYQTTWPRRIQTLNLKKISAAYQKKLYPFVVLLSPKSPGGFTREWRPVIMTPEKHIGYAVQWFALALTLAIMCLVFSIRRRNNEPTKNS